MDRPLFGITVVEAGEVTDGGRDESDVVLAPLGAAVGVVLGSKPVEPIMFVIVDNAQVSLSPCVSTKGMPLCNGSIVVGHGQTSQEYTGCSSAVTVRTAGHTPEGPTFTTTSRLCRSARSRPRDIVASARGVAEAKMRKLFISGLGTGLKACQAMSWRRT